MGAAFRVGDRVRVPIGRGSSPGIIVEDRGAIGFRGRRLCEVKVSMKPFDPVIYERGEDEMEPRGEAPGPGLDGRAVVQYLIEGGLVSILQSNQAGGRTHPKVWMQPDSLGGVTHAFEDWGDSVGGQVVPVLALRGEKISGPKRDEVLALLGSFGVDRAEAEKLVARVGTAL